ncbi:MAG: 50S ribosomal protein L9 [Caulobacteraceae bacterium]|nr:50S ribosomal protein L9 [Caulobacter sp.]
MKVVLLERVSNLGAIGDVVTVKDGFARNFLLPRSKALRATASNLKVFEGQRAAIEQRNADNRDEARRRGDRIDGQSYILIRSAGESGQLYGSVSGRDVAEAMAEGGARVTRGQIVLDRPIKTLGVHQVKVQLHPEVEVAVSVNIARSQDEADRQARGEDVIASQYEDERAQDAQAAADMLEGGAGQAMQDAY